MLHNLSYRLKTPLAMSLVVLVSGLVVGGLLTWQVIEQEKAGLVQQAQALGRTLARSLRTAILHDDTWQAFEILRTPLGPSLLTTAERTEPVDPLGSAVFVVLDVSGRVIAASDPRQFPVLAQFSALASEARLVSLSLQGHEDAVVQAAEPPYLYVVTPVLAEDGTLIGRLVQRYDERALRPRLAQVASSTALSVLSTLALLLPLGWLAGKRLAGPLAHLAECLGRVGHESPGAIQCDFPTGRDEIGQLAERFHVLVQSLAQKQALERHLAQSERLAAIGRLTAAIAHEINNPLGGMLNAISNHRRRGGADTHTQKTLALIERGLLQIRDTVSALLVEARVEGRELRPEDLEDVHTLIAAELQEKGLTLVWHNPLPAALSLPASPVRQILLNLLLNALKASPVGGVIDCRIALDAGRLHLAVSNSGPAIPERRRQHLFEPYFGEEGPEGEGHGLGLWVTYQLVKQLGGDIAVDSVPGRTRFTVRLPLEAHDAG